jgi:uncharacterized membrane protein (Fun14 family)
MVRSEKQMSSEPLLSSIIRFAGSGLLGYAMGFALKKVLKWILIIVGFLTGMFFVGVQLLQKYGYVSSDRRFDTDPATLTYRTLIVSITHLEFLLAAGWRWDSWPGL